MMLSGVVTAVPLLLFAAAAQRLPLVTLGLLMYLTPVMQLTWGVVVGHEPMPPARWIGFGLIWVALAVFSADALYRSRRPPPTPSAGDMSIERHPDRHSHDMLETHKGGHHAVLPVHAYQEAGDIGLTEEDMARGRAAFAKYADDLDAAGYSSAPRYCRPPR